MEQYEKLNVKPFKNVEIRLYGSDELQSLESKP